MELSHKIDVLKNLFYKNRYSIYFVDKFIKNVYRALTLKIALSIVSTKYLMILPSYLGKPSLQIHTSINLVTKNKRS